MSVASRMLHRAANIVPARLESMSIPEALQWAIADRGCSRSDGDRLPGPGPSLTPIGRTYLSFVPLPLGVLLFVIGVLADYCVGAEVFKRRYQPSAPPSRHL